MARTYSMVGNGFMIPSGNTKNEMLNNNHHSNTNFHFLFFDETNISVWESNLAMFAVKNRSEYARIERTSEEINSHKQSHLASIKVFNTLLSQFHFNLTSRQFHIVFNISCGKKFKRCGREEIDM
jgi:hypothetical protein